MTEIERIRKSREEWEERKRNFVPIVLVDGREYTKFFDDLWYAQLELKIRKADFKKAVNNPKLKLCGYNWMTREFYEDPLNREWFLTECSKPKTRNRKKRKIYCYETDQVYSDSYAASDHLRISTASIYNVCGGKTASCKGLHMRYAD